MEQIKVNDFVRTKQGYIAKCVEVDEDGDYYTFDEFVQVQIKGKDGKTYLVSSFNTILIKDE